MYGAILGDIMSYQHKCENDEVFYLVDSKFKFTDYTVMTIAVADALLRIGNIEDYDEYDEVEFKSGIMDILDTWDIKYREVTHPSISLSLENFDISAAAIISVVPYICKYPDEVRKIAKWVAEIIHDDPQSIRNAEIAALAIYYAKDCPYKSVIKNNLEYEMGYTFDNAKKFHNVVLEGIIAFFESTNLEDAINKAISLGGDISTRAVIAGSIVEAFYGVPNCDKSMCNREMDKYMLKVLDRFDEKSRRIFIRSSEMSDPTKTFDNSRIEKAISQFNAADTKDNFNQLMDSIYYGMYEGGELNIPLIVMNRKKTLANGSIPEGDGDYLKIKTYDNKIFIAAFTNLDEELNEKYPDVFLTDIKSLLEEFSDEDVEEDGIIINPHDEDQMFVLTKDLIEQLLKKEPPENGMWFFSGHISKWKTDIAVSSEYDDVNYALFEDETSLAAAHFMTKAHNDTNNYMIYTPLVKYSGDDEKVIRACYWFCLDLAKKYNIHSISFPFNICLNVAGIPGMNEAIGSWLKKNKNYGMMVFVATGEDKNSDEGQLFRVEFMDNEPNDNYELVKWNGKYGDEARFIVKYNKTGKFTLFTPDHIEDIVWVDQDLSQTEEYKHWEDFGGETVNYLENVMM